MTDNSDDVGTVAAQFKLRTLEKYITRTRIVFPAEEMQPPFEDALAKLFNKTLENPEFTGKSVWRNLCEKIFPLLQKMSTL